MTLTMEDVVLTLGLVPRITKSTEDIECPNCGRKILHIDFDAQVFACPVCTDDGISGGVIDAWAVFRKIEGHNRRSLAKKDLEEYFGRNPKSKTIEKKKVAYKKTKRATLDECHEFYTKILSRLTLSDEHRQNLIDRGLNDEQIRLSEVKTLRRIPSRELEELFPGEDLSKYPGFYMRNNKPYMSNLGKGMLIRELSVSGKIQGFQLRRDTTEKNKRYITFAKPSDGGAKGYTFTHYANWKNVKPDTVIITEGPLKGSIINYLTDIPTVAIPGVSSQKFLIGTLTELKKQGLKNVIIAFDMDYYTNANVQRALKKLRKKLSDLEIPYVRYKWDKNYNGYDDYLASKAPE